MPKLPDSVTGMYGKSIQKFMGKLKASQMVKVTVFGQSLCDNGNLWTFAIIDTLKARYPKATVIRSNKAVAGCSSDCLGPQVASQLRGENPDLIIFQVFSNSEASYETVIRNMKAAAPDAEILVWSTHVTNNMKSGAADWFELWEGSMLPKLCARNRLGFAHVFLASKTYLQVTYNDKYDYTRITQDGIHLNQEGQWIVVEILRSCMKELPAAVAAPSGSVPRWSVVPSRPAGEAGSAYDVSGRLARGGRHGSVLRGVLVTTGTETIVNPVR